MIAPGVGRNDPPSDRGATAAEYAIIASLIAAVIVGVVGLLGLQVAGLFGSMLNAWP